MLSLRSLVGISAILKAVQAFPNLPFTVDGPLILDSEGNSVKTAGTNWPGHNDVMIPEGLQYTSVEKVVSDIKSLGMNVVRLTYAIEMIDQIYANDGQDVSIQTAFEDALGVENATVILENVLRNNPQFTAESTRLEIFDAVVEELNTQEIYVNLDNHMSSGEWCCSTDDGNSWWGDEFFNADNWVRGLGYMAEHAANWPNLMSMSIRNELREPSNGPDTVEPYTWEVWYNYVRRGADAVNAANPDPIVILSGLNFDTTMQPVVRGEALTPSDTVFSFDDFEGYADKLAIELHNYNTETDDCPGLQGSLYNGGAQAMNPDEETTVNTFPVLITEFGFNMEDDTYQGVYSTCLAEWMPGNTAGWMQWVVVGSYYMRSGEQDYDETWGLYNHDWSAWRNEEYIEGVMKPSIEATLS